MLLLLLLSMLVLQSGECWLVAAAAQLLMDGRQWN
jgi:hypothetical protein